MENFKDVFQIPKLWSILKDFLHVPCDDVLCSRKCGQRMLSAHVNVCRPTRPSSDDVVCSRKCMQIVLSAHVNACRPTRPSSDNVVCSRKCVQINVSAQENVCR
jgi:predicted nucleic acid-binding Zn ribbon protein